MNTLRFVITVTVMFCLGTTAWAGDSYTLELSSGAGAPGSSVVLNLSIDSSDGDDLQGWQWGMCHDVDVVSIEDGDVSGDPQDDLDEPISFTFEALVFTDGGWTAGVLLAVFPESVLPPGDNTLYACTYAIDAEAEGDTTTGVEFCETLGDPLVTLAVVVDGEAIAPAFNDGVIDIVGATPYVRGDCNDDGINNIADGIRLLSQIFQDGMQSSCFSACDTDGDGEHDQTDAIAIFNYQFLDGPEPVAPFPDCGTGDEDDCEAQSSCE